MDNAAIEVIGLTQSLVRASGTSGDEKDAADIAINAMEALGFCKVVRDEFGSAIGLIGPKDTEIVALFDGHIDTVPVTPGWSVDPFGGEIKDGRLYGCGSTDMKGAVAAAICGVSAAGKTGRLTKQVAVSASVMEEILEGVALAHILDTYTPRSVIICEPSLLELMIAQRGRLEIVLTLHGKPAHASQPHLGENPINLAARALRCLEDIDYLDDPLLGKGVLVPVSIVSDPLPSPSMIPLKVFANFDRRTVPGETRESVFEQIASCLTTNNIDHFTLECFAEPAATYTGLDLCPDRDFPAWTTSVESGEAQAVLRALAASDLPQSVNVWSCCTNGSESAGRRDIPTVGIGPGDIRHAHIIDEFIETSQLVKAVQVYKNLALELAG